jgi:hypothetical protein
LTDLFVDDVFDDVVVVVDDDDDQTTDVGRCNAYPFPNLSIPTIHP